MIEQINLKHYKAFDDVTIPIRPLTILLGANSVGKSAITQMLMLLHQTAEERGSSYASALKIYGQYVNIGAFENLFKQKDTEKPFCLNLVFKSSSLGNEIRGLKSKFVEDFKDLCRYFPLKNLWELKDESVDNKKNFSAFVNKFFELINKKGADEYKPYIEYLLQDRLGIPKKEVRQATHSNIMNTYGMLDYLEKNIEDDIFKLSYEISLNKEKNKLYIDKVTFYIGDDKQLISFLKNKQGLILGSDIFTIKSEDHSIICQSFVNNKTIFDCIKKEERDDTDSTTALSFALCKLLRRIMNQVTDCLSEYKINYVSPLRAHPKRYYMLDKAKMTISLDTLDGDAITEVLKENKEVKNNVNNWLSKFGFEVNVEEFKEVVHHLNVTQNDLNLDITDVGFGISQVLPIIIQGFLSIENSITIIEQPEIHLHPIMQADLGDLFIDIVTSSKKKLLIETHSEYLLKRIRRRISEGKISPGMVSICLFHAKTDEKDAWVETLDIGEKGNFEWPEEFYGGELYNDTLEYLMNQK